jgi:guanylate cyclase
MTAAGTTLVDRIGALIERSSAHVSDSQEQRLQKTLLILSATLMSLGGLVWGVFLLFLAGTGPALIPFGYAALTAVNVVVCRLTGRYATFQFVQLMASLLLPFLLALTLGGFAGSGAVVAWSLMAPMGALLVSSPRQGVRWFASFVAVLVLAGLLDPFVRAPNGLSSGATIVLFAMNLGGPTMAAFLLLRLFVLQKNEALAALALEREKSDRLLLNVLPADIAAKLRNDGHAPAERFDQVSVLFADVVDFTKLSEKLSPQAMLSLLNEIFSYFDELAARYGVEKIRTIGDNYMAVSGAPQRREDHAHALVGMALEMNEYIERRPLEAQDLRFRIGINSGPAMAGVIGHHKFHYDLWGDAVNVASRMESHGLPGRIQVGPDTFALIKDDFDCEPRGPIEIKGKGAMETFWVCGRTGASASV